LKQKVWKLRKQKRLWNCTTENCAGE